MDDRRLRWVLPPGKLGLWIKSWKSCSSTTGDEGMAAEYRWFGWIRVVECGCGGRPWTLPPPGQQRRRVVHPGRVISRTDNNAPFRAMIGPATQVPVRNRRRGQQGEWRGGMRRVQVAPEPRPYPTAMSSSSIIPPQLRRSRQRTADSHEDRSIGVRYHDSGFWPWSLM